MGVRDWEEEDLTAQRPGSAIRLPVSEACPCIEKKDGDEWREDHVHYHRYGLFSRLNIAPPS
jgi:hypothetical protein